MTALEISALFFVAILLGMITMSMWFHAVRTSPSYELKKRLRKLAVKEDQRIPDTLRAEILGEMPPIDRYLYGIGVFRRLDGALDRAGLKVDLKTYVLIITLAAAVGFTLGLILLKNVALALVFLPLGALAPLFFIKVKKDKRAKRFTEEFPSALDMVARSLRAGHAFSASIQMVGMEMGEPVAGLFKTAYEEQTLGLSIKDALAHMSDRMPSMDLRFFVAAVNIHRDIGGNLAELLERLATTIRQRTTIRRQIRVYTAQARLSGYILAVLPLIMAGIIYVMAPDYLKELTSVKGGRIAIGVAVVMQIFGFIAIRKIINIKI